MADVKFCKDCKWAKVTLVDRILPGLGWRYAKCLHPKIGPCPRRLDGDFLASGKKRRAEFFFASTNRKYNCGEEARYFEPKKS